jgi:hypothetical protein
MFLDIDVVEFNDTAIPYRNILLNLSEVSHIEQTNNRHQEMYAAGRQRAIEDHEDDPSVPISPVVHLPQQGAMLVVRTPSGHSHIYYTVTPFTDIRTQVLRLNNTSAA